MSLFERARFNFMHFMPYVHLPEDQESYASLWVDFPNRLYDPRKGTELYQRYLSEFVLADRLGFDALVVNEHHSSAYGMMPACNLIAAALVPQTSRARICTFGSLITIQYPNRVAEEYAMLDVLSGGRLEVAFPFGTGMEYWSNAAQVNPTTARARFKESIDIVRRAWTEDGPFAYDGEFYTYKYLNVWPKPYQQPHPKMWLVGSSPETANLAADLGLAYSSVFVPADAQSRAFAAFRARRAELGSPAQADDLMFSIFCYVAESDDIAEREGKDHILWYFNNALRTTPRYHAPPGYMSPAALRQRLEQGAAAKIGAAAGKMTWEGLKPFRAVAGSPDTVASAIQGWIEQAGASTVLCHLHLGDMPHWKTVKNLTLFAEDVIPRVRGASPSLSADGRTALVAAKVG
jgi:alkanesulfonate monooxygenase SsuD/methylene tetrahydromethanopterin reductase-like flavin-dependent oxidoreductase (luciferase family)